MVRSSRALRQAGVARLQRLAGDEDEEISAFADVLLSLVESGPKGVRWKVGPRFRCLQTQAARLRRGPRPWVAESSPWGSDDLVLNELHLPCDERDWEFIDRWHRERPM